MKGFSKYKYLVDFVITFVKDSLLSMSMLSFGKYLSQHNEPRTWELLCVILVYKVGPVLQEFKVF